MIATSPSTPNSISYLLRNCQWGILIFFSQGQITRKPLILLAQIILRNPQRDTPRNFFLAAKRATAHRPHNAASGGKWRQVSRRGGDRCAQLPTTRPTIAPNRPTFRPFRAWRTARRHGGRTQAMLDTFRVSVRYRARKQGVNRYLDIDIFLSIWLMGIAASYLALSPNASTLCAIWGYSCALPYHSERIDIHICAYFRRFYGIFYHTPKKVYHTPTPNLRGTPLIP